MPKPEIASSSGPSQEQYSDTKTLLDSGSDIPGNYPKQYKSANEGRKPTSQWRDRLSRLSTTGRKQEKMPSSMASYVALEEKPEDSDPAQKVALLRHEDSPPDLYNHATSEGNNYREPYRPAKLISNFLGSMDLNRQIRESNRRKKALGEAQK